MKTYLFHVEGMHCKACVALIESELREMKEVSSAKASLADETLEVRGDFGDKLQEHVATDITTVIAPHGYRITQKKTKHNPRWHEFRAALPIAVAFIALFVALQKAGIVNLLQVNDLSYTTAFLIGIIASLSTCMAVVGGLILSLSATYAKSHASHTLHGLFHVGRLVGFAVLGGAIGLIGSAFQLGITGMFVIAVFVSLVMLVLGLNLLDLAPWLKRFQLSLPSGFIHRIRSLQRIDHGTMPFLIGVATFFMPCGFTQSMQLYALSTGSATTAALLMFFFALGTLPLLSLISFGSFSIRDKAWAGVFFKAAGLVVLFFALFTIVNSFATIGIIAPVFNF